MLGLATREALPEVVDLQSSNGVAVRGKRIDRAILRQGDLVWIGDVCLRVDEIEDDDAPQPCWRARRASW